jgi:hypothetical protein
LGTCTDEAKPRPQIVAGSPTGSKAGNGGGDVLAFDAVGTVYMIPLTGMESEQAINIAGSFAGFAETFELDAERPQWVEPGPLGCGPSTMRHQYDSGISVATIFFSFRRW